MPGKLWGKLRSTVYEGERTLRLMGSFAFTPGDEVIACNTAVKLRPRTSTQSAG